MKKNILCFLLVMLSSLLCGPVSAATGLKSATSLPPPAAALPDIATTSLSELGFKQGHIFQGTGSAHAFGIFFPVPRDGISGNGTLRIHFAASPQLTQRSSIRIDINGNPAKQISLANQGESSWLEIPVAENELHSGSLKVMINVAIVASDDRCLDERMLSLEYVRILPDSRLDLPLSTSANSLRWALTTLPEIVRISVPAELTAGSLDTLVKTGVLLVKSGKQVELIRLPALGEVIIGSADELTGAGIALSGEAHGTTFLLPRPGKTSAIVLSGNFNPALFGLSPAWNTLLLDSAYQQLQSTAPAAHDDGYLPLDALGISSEVKYPAPIAEWSTDISPAVLSADMLLETLHLNIVAAPEPTESRALVYVYLNGLLQEVKHIENDGKPHSMRFRLKESDQRADVNSLKIVVQRELRNGDCKGNLRGYPVQILPDSGLKSIKKSVEPKKFNDLRAYFSSGVDVFIDPAALIDNGRSFSLLAATLAHHHYPIGHVQLLKKGDPFSPKSPFLLFGSIPVELSNVGVHFDRGHIRVEDRKQQLLLDMNPLTDITVAQLVSKGSIHGLWIAPASGGKVPRADNFLLDMDDVAFADEQGVVLTLNTRYPTLARVDYPEYTTWLDFLNRYRFWLIALGWTALVVVLLMVYRKVRKHHEEV